MKEEVLNDVGKAKFAAYEYEQKIALLEKERFIHQQQVQIHQQLLRQKSLITEMLIGAIVAFLLIGLIILRNIMLKRRNEAHRREIAENDLNMQKLESEKTKARLLHQKTELEMQALRAQMNPHFIFNSLNSINRFILQNNRLMASEFLTKFSRLVRLILQNSQASMITLESELECLGLYLELEALRFNYHFEYKISLSEDLDLSLLKVPPLIIQPYVENAIWHGLMHKEEKGQLDVELWQDGEELYIKIADNGVGREQASALKSKTATKHKSVGLEITVNRIAMLRSETTNKSPVVINDLVEPDGAAAGTEVILQLPTIYD
jgi:LytS/YehU family sensor histidine kinase